MYPRVVICLTLFYLAGALTGCKNSSNQQNGNGFIPQNSPPGNSAPANTPNPPPAPAPAPAQPQALVVPADTVFSVVLDESLSSKRNSPGDEFSASVRAPIEVDGQVAIPKHAHVNGVVKDAKAAGHFKGGALLELTLTSITVDGEKYRIQTTSPEETTKGKGKRTTEMVGGGAGGGAAIGAVAGGGKGALIGGLIGAAAGTGGAGLTGNHRDIVLPAESTLRFRLLQPVEIKPNS